jgi:ABC-type glycerol-3-phosphate transport system permease component
MKNNNTNNAFKKRISPFNLIIAVILVLYAITIIFSLYFILTTAFKTRPDFDENFFGLPKTINFDNITRILSERIIKDRNGEQFAMYIIPDIILYTIMYSVGSALTAALVPCVAAYFAAKFNYKFSGFLVAVVVAVMIIPIVGNIPATINMLNTLNIYGEIYSLWIMKGNFVNMWFLVFYAAFKSLPNDYMEAAYIDGASELKVMLQVVFPLIRTTFSTVVLIFFVDLWNDYQSPLLFTPGYPTLAMIVHELSTSNKTGLSSAPVRMASCALMVVPTLVIFIVFKDKLMGNLTMGGIKG